MSRQQRLEQVCMALKADVHEVIGLWEGAAKREPWILLPQQDRTDSLPECLERLADAALTEPPKRSALLALATSAAEHGKHRSDMGMPDTLVLSEYYLLRNALWSYLSLKGMTQDDVMPALNRIDVALTLATRASMLGYHREQLEKTGTWKGTLEGLVDESPLGRA